MAADIHTERKPVRCERIRELVKKAVFLSALQHSFIEQTVFAGGDCTIVYVNGFLA